MFQRCRKKEEKKEKGKIALLFACLPEQNFWLPQLKKMCPETGKKNSFRGSKVWSGKKKEKKTLKDQESKVTGVKMFKFLLVSLLFFLKLCRKVMEEEKKVVVRILNRIEWDRKERWWERREFCYPTTSPLNFCPFVPHTTVLNFGPSLSSLDLFTSPNKINLYSYFLLRCFLDWFKGFKKRGEWIDYRDFHGFDSLPRFLHNLVCLSFFQVSSFQHLIAQHCVRTHIFSYLHTLLNCLLLLNFSLSNRTELWYPGDVDHTYNTLLSFQFLPESASYSFLFHFLYSLNA